MKLGVTPPTKYRKLLGVTFETTREPQFVIVEGSERDPNHASELKALLVDYLRAVGRGEDLQQAALPELLSRAVAHAGVIRETTLMGAVRKFLVKSRVPKGP